MRKFPNFSLELYALQTRKAQRDEGGGRLLLATTHAAVCSCSGRSGSSVFVLEFQLGSLVNAMLSLSLYIYIYTHTHTHTHTAAIVTLYGPEIQGIESRWGVILSAPVQTGPEEHPTCTRGAASFPGVKRPGHGVYHPHPSSTRLTQ